MKHRVEARKITLRQTNEERSFPRSRLTPHSNETNGQDERRDGSRAMMTTVTASLNNLEWTELLCTLDGMKTRGRRQCTRNSI